MKISICNEQEKYFEFCLEPNELALGDGFANSCVDLIDKISKEYCRVHFSVVIKDPILKEIE